MSHDFLRNTKIFRKTKPLEDAHEQRLEIPDRAAKCLSKKDVFEPSYGRLSACAFF